MKRIRIIKAPLESKEFGGSKTNGNMIYPMRRLDQMSEGGIRVAESLEPVPEDEATVEAENGETIYIPNMGGLAAQFKVKGKRHSQGGTPMNPPDDSFFFSDTHKMKIKDPEMLKEFGKFTKKIGSGYTPAELSEQYKINEYRKVLADKNSDKLQRSTAEKMIGNYNLKLGKLALVQESSKGFPDGIPAAALPYLAANSVDPNQILPLKSPEQQQQQHQMPDGSMMDGMPHAQYGGGLKYFNKGGSNTGTYMDGNYFREGGELPQYQEAGPVPAKGAYQASPNETTPEGKNPSSLWTTEELKVKYKEQGIDYENMTDAEAQSALYDKSDPYERAFMWGHVGMTKKGLKLKLPSTFPSWKPKDGESHEQYKARLKAAGYTPESLEKELAPLKPAFTDGYRGLREAWLLTPPKKAAAVVTDKPLDDKGPVLESEKMIPGFKRSAPAKWWLQDKIKTAGAATDFLRIKKYLPWEAPVSPYIGQPTFYDPTREMAANAEIANIGTQGASTFADPNQFSATFSGIQGAAAANAANILGKYNNENVTVANTFNALKSDIFNRAGEANANMAKRLYDGTTLANQNFDNAKNMARQELRQSYIDAVTNRAQTQTLNTLYPHYQVDPRTGGFLNFSQGSKMKPGAVSSQQEAAAKSFASIVREYPDIDQRVLAKMFGMGDVGPNDSSPYTNDVPQGAAEWLKAQQNIFNQSNINKYDPSYNPTQ